jgi:DNA-binding SARP family transcriptional activator
MTSPSEDASATLRFTVLGPVRAWRADTELDLGSRQQRLMVALLLAHAGQFVSVAEFVDLLWGAEPPARAVNVIHRHIGAMRRLLEPQLPPRSVGRFLERRHGGYRLPVESDLIAFRGLVERARARAEHDGPAAALPTYIEALGLWRGRCAAGLEAAAALHPAFASVDRERTVVAREAADAALSAGAVQSVLGPLREAAERDPYDEPLQARLILALAIDGKQAEAVAMYRRWSSRRRRSPASSPRWVCPTGPSRPVSRRRPRCTAR